MPGVWLRVESSHVPHLPAEWSRPAFVELEGGELRVWRVSVEPKGRIQLLELALEDLSCDAFSMTFRDGQAFSCLAVKCSCTEQRDLWKKALTAQRTTQVGALDSDDEEDDFSAKDDGALIAEDVLAKSKVLSVEETASSQADEMRYRLFRLRASGVLTYYEAVLVRCISLLTRDLTFIKDESCAGSVTETFIRKSDGTFAKSARTDQLHRLEIVGGIGDLHKVATGLVPSPKQASPLSSDASSSKKSKRFSTRSSTSVGNSRTLTGSQRTKNSLLEDFQAQPPPSTRRRRRSSNFTDYLSAEVKVLEPSPECVVVFGAETLDKRDAYVKEISSYAAWCLVKESATASIDRIVTTGWLLKKGPHKLHRWRKRFFVYRTSGVLDYFESEFGGRRLGSIDLHEKTAVDLVEGTNGNKILQISTPKRVWMLSAAAELSSGERDRHIQHWATEIRNSAAFYDRYHTRGSTVVSPIQTSDDGREHFVNLGYDDDEVFNDVDHKDRVSALKDKKSTNRRSLSNVFYTDSFHSAASNKKSDAKVLDRTLYARITGNVPVDFLSPSPSLAQIYLFGSGANRARAGHVASYIVAPLRPRFHYQDFTPVSESPTAQSTKSTSGSVFDFANLGKMRNRRRSTNSTVVTAPATTTNAMLSSRRRSSLNAAMMRKADSYDASDATVLRRSSLDDLLVATDLERRLNGLFASKTTPKRSVSLEAATPVAAAQRDSPALSNLIERANDNSNFDV